MTIAPEMNLVCLRADWTGEGGPMSDELLVVRCQLGEREAFAELVRGWHPVVERYVGRMLGRSDDDVVQEIWLAIFKGLPRLRRPDRFTPWLFVVARRAVMTGCGTRTGVRSPNRSTTRRESTRQNVSPTGRRSSVRWPRFRLGNGRY
jgi:DNA-directed RNA polymerase specialized sigma24 family protein